MWDYLAISIELVGEAAAILVSQKCQYAVRAVFELALRQGGGPVPIAQIAEAQCIPPRFLEVILSQLKQAGFVESRRGNEGGYLLTRSPEELTVGDVMNFVQGPVGPVECLSEGSPKCSLRGSCVFLPMWERVRQAMSEVYDSTTFASLVDQARQKSQPCVPFYCI